MRVACRRLRPAAILLMCGLGVSSARAETFALGEANVTIGGTASVGTAIRTQSPDRALIGPANAALVGLSGASPAGRNQDDGNLNWRRGEPVSTVAKLLLDVDVKYDTFGAFVRTIAWRDFALTDTNRPWGNVPNNYTPGVPLGESSNSS